MYIPFDFEIDSKFRCNQTRAIALAELGKLVSFFLTKLKLKLMVHIKLTLLS